MTTDGSAHNFYTWDDLDQGEYPYKAIRRLGLTGCPDSDLWVFDLSETARGRVKAFWSLHTDRFAGGTFLLSAGRSNQGMPPAIREEIAVRVGRQLYDVEVAQVPGLYRLEVLFPDGVRRMVLAEDFVSARH